MIDFGSSCYENQRVYTYIQSRFYRAPEVILGGKYGMPIDMWSLGCILAELLTGYALFPGEDENDQLACIIELLGMPPQKLLDQSKRTKNFFSQKGYPRYCSVETLDDGRVILGAGTSRQGKERGPPGSKSLRKALKGCDDPLFMNFLCGCLEWDPEYRMTPAAALKHSWFRRRLPRPPAQQQITSGSATGATTVTTTTATTATVAMASAAMIAPVAESITIATIGNGNGGGGGGGSPTATAAAVVTTTNQRSTNNKELVTINDVSQSLAACAATS